MKEESDYLPKGDKKMPWGKYEGQKLKDIPKGYFRFLWEKNLVNAHKWTDVYIYIKENTDII